MINNSNHKNIKLLIISNLKKFIAENHTLKEVKETCDKLINCYVPNADLIMKNTIKEYAIRLQCQYMSEDDLNECFKEYNSDKSQLIEENIKVSQNDAFSNLNQIISDYESYINSLVEINKINNFDADYLKSYSNSLIYFLNELAKQEEK